jgi:putative ABC transport system permease protein
MTRLLARLLGRLPIGWLQLVHQRGRFAAALSGVAFANVLVFVQLGLMSSMGVSTLRPYEFFQGDILISAADANTLTDGGNVARQWMLQALADPDVVDGIGLFVAMVPWDRGETDISLTTFGVDPFRADFLAPEIAADIGRCKFGTQPYLIGWRAGSRAKKPQGSGRKRRFPSKPRAGP